MTENKGVGKRSIDGKGIKSSGKNKGKAMEKAGKRQGKGKGKRRGKISMQSNLD